MMIFIQNFEILRLKNVIFKTKMQFYFFPQEPSLVEKIAPSPSLPQSGPNLMYAVIAAIGSIAIGSAE